MIDFKELQSLVGFAEGFLGKGVLQEDAEGFGKEVRERNDYFLALQSGLNSPLPPVDVLLTNWENSDRLKSILAQCYEEQERVDLIQELRKEIEELRGSIS